MAEIPTTDEPASAGANDPDRGDPHRNDPLHGVTLKAMVEDLVNRRGWGDLAWRIRIRCFSESPSIGSSLKFLRRTPWAREKVERLYLRDLRAARRDAERD